MKHETTCYDPEINRTVPNSTDSKVGGGGCVPLTSRDFILHFYACYVTTMLFATFMRHDQNLLKYSIGIDLLAITSTELSGINVEDLRFSQR